MRYWASWTADEVDYRPLRYPPGPAILGWWCSGYEAKGRATICALVEAEDEAGVLEAARLDWPEAMEPLRFCHPVEPGFVLSDRFPLKDWMRERMERRP